MAKRFVDTAKYRQAWRKLDPKLRTAYYWLTENCDPAGYWTIDLEHFKFECGYSLDIERFIAETGAAEKHGEKTLRLLDFIEVNYGELREAYNPHKPALRALAHHQAEPISSLKQASTKLEDEDEEEDEDENNSGEKERAGANAEFEILWTTYQGHGVKKTAREYWHKLPKADREAISAKAADYIASTSGARLKYRKYLEGWINPSARLWERPIVQDSTPMTPTEKRNATVATRGKLFNTLIPQEKQ